jgi:membrane associated rhomboid family serine protease
MSVPANAPSTREPLGQRVKSRLLVLAALTAAMWVLLLVPLSAREQLGIRSQRAMGLLGVPVAPFLHGDLAHLASNTLPFFVLGALVLLRSWREFVLVSLIVMVGSGLGAWYFGRLGDVHLGVSGLIFGYFGFLVARGLLERTLVSLIIAAVVGFYYGGLLFQVIPREQHISWQAHLFGLLSGLVAAWGVARKRWAAH